MTVIMILRKNYKQNLIRKTNVLNVVVDNMIEHCRHCMQPTQNDYSKVYPVYHFKTENHPERGMSY